MLAHVSSLTTRTMSRLPLTRASFVRGPRLLLSYPSTTITSTPSASYSTSHSTQTSSTAVAAVGGSGAGQTWTPEDVADDAPNRGSSYTFTQYNIYAGKAAITLKPILPTVVPIEAGEGPAQGEVRSGATRRNEEGVGDWVTGCG
jgi:hypothetical protein